MALVSLQGNLSGRAAHRTAGVVAVHLPLIESCDDCGACCMKTPVPPFEPGEEVMRCVTDEQYQPIRDRVDADQQFDDLPCVWLDLESRRCLHYEQRPGHCRTFEIGSDLCRLSRCDIGLPG